MFIGSFLWIAMLRSGVLDGTAIGPLRLDIAKEYQFYLLAGTIGGSLYALRLFYWHNIRQKLNIRKWWIWYLLRPIMSGGTAAIMMVMVQVGNSLVALISLAFLMGYGFGKVMDKLDALTETFVNGFERQSQEHTAASERTVVNKPVQESSSCGSNGSQNPDQPIEQIKS
jgi:hypothetical protein